MDTLKDIAVSIMVLGLIILGGVGVAIAMSPLLPSGTDSGRIAFFGGFGFGAFLSGSAFLVSVSMLSSQISRNKANATTEKKSAEQRPSHGYTRGIGQMG